MRHSAMAKLDSVGDGVAGAKSNGGGDGLAVGRREHSVKELLRVKEIPSRVQKMKER